MTPDGATLRLWRERAGLTRREASALAGVTTRALARIETGRRAPPPGLGDWLRRVYFEGRRAAGGG